MPAEVLFAHGMHACQSHFVGWYVVGQPCKKDVHKQKPDGICGRPCAIMWKCDNGDMMLFTLLAQARRPDMDMMVSGGQIVDAIVKLLQDEEAAQAWS